MNKVSYYLIRKQAENILEDIFKAFALDKNSEMYIGIYKVSFDLMTYYLMMQKMKILNEEEVNKGISNCINSITLSKQLIDSVELSKREPPSYIR